MDVSESRPPPKTFVDTNVFVYSVDLRDPRKRDRAVGVLSELGARAVVSPQILKEFYSVVTNRLDPRMPPEDAAAGVQRLLRLTVVTEDATMVAAAIRLSRESVMSIWDAALVQAAATSGCARLLTEDLNHGQVIAGVKIENPFLDLDGAGG